MKWIFLSLFLIFGSCRGNRKALEIDEQERVEKTLNETKLEMIGTENPDELDIKRKHKYQILLGIQIDNYSKYNLKNPVFNPGSSYVNNLTQFEDVESKNSKFFVLDNSAYWQRYVYGSIAWEIEKSQNYRIVLTFNIPWK